MASSVAKAFQAVPREIFLPEKQKRFSGIDAPLPIGWGQTNSQPYTVQLMLEWLDVRAGEKVLDVGSGSGWTTALLSRIVGPKGRVYAVERVPELVKFGEDNCKRAGIKNAQFHQAGKVFGLPNGAPFDRILVSAATSKLPKALLKQLKSGGKMVIPVGNSICEITKNSEADYKLIDHPGFAFVPLV